MKIPEYITIEEKDNFIIIKDTRTNFFQKIWGIPKPTSLYAKESKDWGIGQAIHTLKKQYQKTLPIEERQGTNTPTDFNCPHCLSKDKIEIIKKPRIGTYSSGIWYARHHYKTVDLQNVYKCTVCKNQFTENELNNKKFEIDKTNKLAILFEQLDDKIITEKEYQDKRFEIEMGMTKAEYDIEKAKEEKEDRQNTRFNFSTKNYFIILGIGLIITIILSIIYPQPNPCEKYGSDWEFSSGGSRVRSACVNSNGDIKYIK